MKDKVIDGFGWIGWIAFIAFGLWCLSAGNRVDCSITRHLTCGPRIAWVQVTDVVNLYRWTTK